MSEENVQRMRELYAGFARGDLRGRPELFSTEFVFEPMADGRRAYVGLQAFADQMREFLAQWDDFRMEGLEFEDLGDAVLVTERQSGTGKASGVEIDMTFYAVWTFRDDVIVRGRWDPDRESALRGYREG